MHKQQSLTRSSFGNPDDSPCVRVFTPRLTRLIQAGFFMAQEKPLGSLNGREM